MKEFLEKLLERLKGASKIVFMGVGEEKLSDDGVGPFIIAELLNYSSDKVLFINAGIDPMARIEDIEDFNPSHLVLIDTCTLNAVPGTVSILNRDQISELVPISTHTIPVHLVVDLIIKKLPQLKSFMIGIVPKSLEGFEGELRLYKSDKYEIEDYSKNIDLPFFEIKLTDIIQEVANQLIEIIKEIISKL